MTSIAFHFNAPAKVAYACRLLRKAVASGSTVAVLVDESSLDQLDQQLWSFSPLDFVPHGRVSGLSSQQLQHTPVWLCAQADEGHGRQVLVNLTQRIPENFEAFERVIEIVSQDEKDRQNARLRWKHYTDRSISIVKYDLNQAS